VANAILDRKERTELAEEKTSTATAETVCREVVIRGVTYRLTSTFEGLKDLDATVKRLAVKRATQPLIAK